MYHDKTANVSKGKWKGILLELGLPESCLRDKHGPCPMCGGEDRFRWDNKNGAGTYICNVCGAGDGMKLAMCFTGKAFPEVAAQIDRMVGNIKPGEAPNPDLTEEDRRQILRQTYAATKPVVPGDLADAYLTSRGVGEVIYPSALRFGAALRDGEGGVRPALVAMVGLHGQAKFVSMHRTFLRPDGLAKAEMAAPRKLMPGHLAYGACVMLTEYTGGALGIAEGIETAMSASALYELPVWAAINATMLAKWIPPEGCDEVAIFGDNDPKFGGQSAAFTLAHRLACKGVSVSVHIPPQIGIDWNDALMHRKGKP
jgi:putative DNA primase/helicase